MIRLNSKYTNFFCNTFLINYYSSFFYKYLMYNLIVNTMFIFEHLSFYLYITKQGEKP